MTISQYFENKSKTPNDGIIDNDFNESYTKELEQLSAIHQKNNELLTNSIPSSAYDSFSTSLRNSNDIYIRPSYEARVTELNTKHEDGVMDSDDDEIRKSLLEDMKEQLFVGE